MSIELILKLVCIIAGALASGIPAIISGVRSAKKLRIAKTEIEKAEAYKDMKKQMIVFIQAAEIAYKDVNNVLKAKGSSAGSVKKDSVLTKLQAYATEHSYDFDYDMWSNEIDEQVAVTKNVN